jgi:hypothetical protein
MSQNLGRSGLFAALGILLLGCSGGDIGKVKGQVTLDGQPLPGALVVFQPEDGSRPSTGRTDDAGKYELLYSREVKGAKVGKHKVSITTGSESDGEKGKPEVVVEKVPAKYNVKSELVREVKPGTNEIDFALDSKGERFGPGVPPPKKSADGCGFDPETEGEDQQD